VDKLFGFMFLVIVLYSLNPSFREWFDKQFLGITTPPAVYATPEPQEPVYVTPEPRRVPVYAPPKRRVPEPTITTHTTARTRTWIGPSNASPPGCGGLDAAHCF
jgi:hypothetical protein